MFNRNILKKLELWRLKQKRKPLVLRGARQVGKTSAIRLFSESFANFVELNLELEAHRNLFKRSLPVNDLWQAILLSQRVELIPGETLLCIDEIQQVPEAAAMLRYFYEQLPHIHVIAAGSLLEMRLGAKQISFPVGRVEFLYLYPLSFPEYLAAQEEDQLLALLDTIPFPDFALPAAFQAFHRYTLLGGMPEVISHFIQSPDVSRLSSIYHSLLQTYKDDVEKYAPKSSHPIRHCIEVAPYEAGKRIKFGGFGQSNYKSKEMSVALRTLQQAMLLRLMYPTTSVEIPAQRNRKKSPRLQFLDTGLINYAAGLQSQFFEFTDLHAIHRGLLAEHVVGQELLCQSDENKEPLFWVREKTQSNAEVDYLLPYQTHLIPVEVKAGKAGTLRSLHQFMDRCDHDCALRLHTHELAITKTKTQSGKPYTLLNLPLFLACQIDSYLDWFVGEARTAI